MVLSATRFAELDVDRAKRVRLFATERLDGSPTEEAGGREVDVVEDCSSILRRSQAMVRNASRTGRRVVAEGTPPTMSVVFSREEGGEEEKEEEEVYEAVEWVVAVCIAQSLADSGDASFMSSIGATRDADARPKRAPPKMVRTKGVFEAGSSAA